MVRLYEYWESGNCYKVRLLLNQLQIPVETVQLDILKGETRKPAFLAKNPNGRVPLLELPDGRLLAESNAILWYLAEDSELLAADPWKRAQTLQWMFFEQYSHEPYIAVLRFWHFAGLAEERGSEIPERKRRGYDALGVMERRLEERSFFVGERYSVADVALYAYTHVAGEGGFDLEPYPAICAWLERVRSQPRHVVLTERVGQPVEWPTKNVSTR